MIMTICLTQCCWNTRQKVRIKQKLFFNAHKTFCELLLKLCFVEVAYFAKILCNEILIMEGAKTEALTAGLILLL